MCEFDTYMFFFWGGGEGPKVGPTLSLLVIGSYFVVVVVVVVSTPLG